MPYTDNNINEYNSLVSIVRTIDVSNSSYFTGSNSANYLLNSSTYINNHSRFESNLHDALLDDKYFDLLNKLGKEYNLNNFKLSRFEVEEAFSKIYRDLIDFGYCKISVELTFDDTLIFSLNKDGEKYILQYFLDFDPFEEDDIEAIFSNQSRQDNTYLEGRYSSIRKKM